MSEMATAEGMTLRIRDGLSLLMPNRDRRVDGMLLFRGQGCEAGFYDAVLAIEPANHYRAVAPLEVATASDPRPANTLWARRPERGSEDHDGSWWTAGDDPLLVEGLAVVRQHAERLLGGGSLISL